MNNTAHSLLRLGEFRCLNISSLIKTVSWRNQDGAKLLAKVEGRKLHLAKITLYTVFYIFLTGC